jgi:hypothetical protein
MLPAWFAENLKRWALPVLIGTWRRALRPMRFWDQVRVIMQIRRGRLVMFAAIAILMSYASMAVARGAWEVWFVQGMRIPRGTAISLWLDWKAALYAAAFPVGTAARAWDLPPHSHFAVLVLAWMLFMPLPFLVLRQTFMRLRVRPVHLLRMWAYSLAALPLLLAGAGLVHLGATWLRASIGYTQGGSLYIFVYRVTSIAFQSDWVIVLFAGLWLVAFWGRGVRDYLRLPNARAVVSLMLLAAFLAALAVASYYPGSKLTQTVGYWIAW